MSGLTRPFEQHDRSALLLFALTIALAVIRGTEAKAVDIDVLRRRAVGGLIDCLFAPSCGLSDFGDDGYVSLADVVLAQER